MVTTLVDPAPDATALRDPDPRGSGRPSGLRDRITPHGRITPNGAVTATIGLLAFVLYSWDLRATQIGNVYYAAAVKSASLSWKAMFFGAIDPRGFITVDKPPAALWLMATSARIFGFGTLSMMLPEVLCGVGSVLLLHRLVRKWAGDVAAHLAALGLAVTPVAALMFRYNNPDALLTLLCIGAALAMWSAIETGRTRWLLVAAALVGLGFDTKMLQAFLVLPAFVVTYLVVGPPKLGRRLLQLAAAAATLAVTAGWWVAVVSLWPRASRPWVGSTRDNSVIGLITGYNGLNRVLGHAHHVGPGPATGVFRMFNRSVGGQVAWLLPLAVTGIAVGLWTTRRRVRTDRERAGWLLFAGWLGGCGLVFSISQGIFHAYYAIQLAPAAAALAAAGAVALWRLGHTGSRLAVALPAAVLGSGVWAVVLLRRTPSFAPWLTPLVALAAVLGALGLLANTRILRPGRLAVAAVVAGASLLAGPFAYAATTVAHPMTGANVFAGPRPGSSHRRLVDVAATPGTRSLVAYLEAHRAGHAFLAAAFTSSGAGPMIVASGQPVVTMGGFGGNDPTPSLRQFERMVRHDQVRYVLFPPPPGDRTPPPLPPGHRPTAPTILPSWTHQLQLVAHWSEAHGRRVVPPSGRRAWPGTLYDLDARDSR